MQVIRHSKYTLASLHIFLFLAADVETLTSFKYYRIFKKDD